MKITYIIIILILSITFVYSQSEWKMVYEYSKKNIALPQMGIDCADSMNCISVASPQGGSMYIRTTDGGYTWFTQFKDVAEKIYNEKGEWVDSKPSKFKAAQCIDFVTPNFVVIGHEEGQISISRDGGYTFDSIKLDTKQPVKSSEEIRVVKFSDSLTGIATTFNLIFLTTDAGVTWSNIRNNINYSGFLVFLSAFIKDDFIYGGGFFSTDKGKTWTQSHPVKNISAMYGVYFIDDKEGWCVGRRQVIPNTTLYTDVILHTTNSGLDWETQLDTLLYPQIGLTGDIYFTNRYEGLAYGDEKIWRTTDGGKNWYHDNFKKTEMVDSFKELAFPNGTTHKILANEYMFGRIWMYEDITSVNEDQATIRHSLSPNPATDFITINYDYEGNRASSPALIYDILGVKVAQEPLINGNNKINISHLTPGVYFIKIGDKVEKFIKI